MSNNYDVIVIGAGNGGLAAAAECARAGLKTLLLEKHNIPGGSASSFVRGRFEFEPSLHELCTTGTPEKPENVGEVFQKLFPILRTRSVFLTLEGAEGERVLNYFAYGVKTVVEARDSRDSVIFNLGGDNIGDKAPLVKCERSELTVVNAQRYNGVLHEFDAESEFSLYNPTSVDKKRENSVIRGVEAVFETIRQ